MRADKTRRLLLHAGLFRGMKYTVESEKHVRFSCLSESGSLDVYLLKFRSKEDASSALNHFGDLLSKLSE